MTPEGLGVPRDLAWVTHLGRPLSVHHASLLLALVLIGMWAIAIAIGGGLAGVLLQHPLGLSNTGTWVLVAVLWVLAAGTVGFYVGSRAGRTAVLYEGGVALKESDRVRAWSWEDITEISVAWQRAELDTPTDQVGVAIWAFLTVAARMRGGLPWMGTVTIFDRYGGRARVDTWFQGNAAFAHRVESEVTPRVEPAIRDRLARGETVTFGTVDVALADGLRVRDRMIAWGETSHLEVRPKALVIAIRDAKPIMIGLEHLRNANVLLGVLREHVGISAGGRP